MNRKRILAWLLCILLLTGCTAAQEPTLPPETTVPPESTMPPVTQTFAPETEPQPLHSPLYIPGVEVEDVILWFHEVCLDAEFVNSGDPSRLQKWDEPISYMLYGDWTVEDLATLSCFAAWLNGLEGFPGMREAREPGEADLRIHICSSQEMVELLGDNFYGMDGGVVFWYQEDRIYDGTICLREGMDQTLRNSVILEELYNGLGPIQDTTLRPDSIICAEYAEPQALTEIDELILKLLYHPDMKCGMNREECETVIRSLYF